jgi:hypothetical protein
MFFNFSEGGDGDTVIAPVTAFNDTEAESYVDGSSLRYYDFAIIRFANFTNDPNGQENIDCLLDVEAGAAWVEEQDEAGNFPAFPSDCDVQEVEVLPSSTGYVAGMDERTAKYMVQIRIEYLQTA